MAAKKKIRIGIAPRGGAGVHNSIAARGCVVGAPVRGDCQPVDWGGQQNVQAGPNQAGGAPAELVQEEGAQRPADRAGKASDQRDAGDGAARLATIEPGQRGKGRVIKTHADTNAEHSPSDDQARDPVRGSEYH
ncbi:MAG: hypothetical protein WA417_03090 [Stellaceae bacterium]